MISGPRLLQRTDLERKLSDTTARVLIACDFDGTLAPIVSHPDLARLPESTEGTLRELAATDRVVLAILSGRALQDLGQRVQVPCVLAGNHGLEVGGAGIQFEHPTAAQRAILIDEAQRLLTPRLATYPGAWIENKRLTATVHYRGVDASQRYQVLWSVRQALRPFGLSIGMRAGKCSLELHPRVDWHKGHALRHIRETLGLNDSPCLVFGDDSTDETMFRDCPADLTVHVGAPRRTAARFFLPDPVAVSSTLEQCVDLIADCSTPLARAAV